MDALVPLLIVGGIVFVVLLRVFMGQADRARIQGYIRGNGGTVESIHWNPFGTGWFGDSTSRIYEVRYRDMHGNDHRATCKTSMLTGVYWTEDEIVHHARPRGPAGRAAGAEDSDEAERLRAENRRLREELERERRERDRR